MKFFSISLSENLFKSKTASFIPPNCAIHSVTVADSVCTVCASFFQNRKSYRLEFCPEELLLELVDGRPFLCLYMSKPPLVEAEGDFVYEAGSKFFNFLTENRLFELKNLNFILQKQLPGLFFRNNDCLMDLAVLLEQAPALGFFQNLSRWSFLWLLRLGFRLRLFPLGEVFKLELLFH